MAPTQRLPRLRGEMALSETAQLRFERVWQAHRPRIWRMVARLAGSLDAADDLTQQVGVQAFQGFGAFRGEAQALTWLTRIAVNVVLRHREGRRPPTDSLDAHVHLPADAAHGPEALSVKSALQTAVWVALDRLPDALRTALILQTYEGLKYREIAAILDIPLGTVKSRLHHALLRLREELKDHEL